MEHARGDLHGPVAPRPQETDERPEPAAAPGPAAIGPAGGASQDTPSYDDVLGIPTSPAATDAETRTPIFESMESNWFRGSPGPRERSADTAEPARGGPPQPQAPTQRPGPGATAAGLPPQRESAGMPGGGGPGGSGEAGPSWGASPNDERWRQAEQLRQPAAGGVTTSGLPRRVPRANLVAGTAQQHSTARTGPQVSRAPDDVRGRLTNLRRGIQQGRQAGSDGRGFGPTHHQER